MKPSHEIQPDPGCLAPMLPGLFWASADHGSQLWAACLAGEVKSGLPLDRLLAMSRIFGYHPDSQGLCRLANIAWCNGAWFSAAGLPVEPLEVLVSGSRSAADPLARAVMAVPGIAGTESHPLPELRQMLARVLGNDPLARYGSLPNLLGLAALAGWQAHQQEHLVTCRAVDPDILNQMECFLCSLLVADHRGLLPSEAREVLSRVIGFTYSLPCEREEIIGAVARSLRAVRSQGWNHHQFLQDALVQGRRLVRKQPHRVQALLLESGLMPLKSTEACFIARCGEYQHACDSQALASMLTWFLDNHSDLLVGSASTVGLLGLRHAYDYLFWFGLLREIRQTGSLGSWLHNSFLPSAEGFSAELCQS